ncbi:MAG: aminotransferase class I/II-fold pyridoxal phosphate-dependent enzyme [Chthoniobacterales bacterium]
MVHGGRGGDCVALDRLGIGEKGGRGDRCKDRRKGGFHDAETSHDIRYCQKNADLAVSSTALLRQAATDCGLAVYGGKNAPYIWVKGPAGRTSWELFDTILNEANAVITPGSGFGLAGEGYFRISAFNSRANVEEVARRFKALSW